MSQHDITFPPEVVSLCRRLQQAGFPSYLVGGCVRDALRGVPYKDLDLATAARPEQVLDLLTDLRVVPTGIDHGTVTVMVPFGGKLDIPVEVTTFRGEGTYSDGRRPDQVVFLADVREDLKRRDFTINAIAYDPVADVLVDPHGGQLDLEAQVVRAVGSAAERFAEDGLRVMRAIRFAVRLDFDIEEKTYDAIPGAIESLRRVSRERVRDELLKTLAVPEAGSVHRGIMMMAQGAPCILDVISEELSLAVRAPGTVDGEGYSQHLWGQPVLRVPREHRLAAFLWPLRAWAAQHPEGQAGVEKYLYEALRLTGRECGHLAAALRMQLPDWAREPRPDLPRWELRESDLPRVRRWLCGAPNYQDAVTCWHFVQQEYLRVRNPSSADSIDLGHLGLLVARARAVGFPLRPSDLKVSGHDLIGELGFKPGPGLGEVLRHLHGWVLDDPARNDRDLLLAQARQWVRSGEGMLGQAG